MKRSVLRCLFAFAVAFVLSGEGVLGQSNAQPTSAKIAVIYSDAFADEKAGITRFLAIRKTLELEFEPMRSDLLKLKTQMDGLEKELRDGVKVPDINSAANKVRQLERLKREFGFRSNEANTTFEERYAELAKPISEDVSKALAEFAKKNGIAVLIDASKTGGVYVYSNAVDMTSSFVAYFNALPAKPTP
jgi:Skp family chaperone for outer membrane proteins